MCLSSYEDYGKPRDTTDQVRYTAGLINEVYQQVGGERVRNVLIRWNIEDKYIDYCLDCLELTDIELACLRCLKGLTLEQRAAALALHEGLITVA